MDQQIVARVLGDDKPLGPDVRPASLVTTTYDEVVAEVGDLAKSEEDVLMYALFPNEALQYLSAHREGAEKTVFMLSEEIRTVREDESVDVSQIRELIRAVETSDVSEVVVEENGSTVTVRKGGFVMAAPAAAASASAPPVVIAAAASGADAPRPATWREVKAPMVGTFYRSPSPGSEPFVQPDDVVEEGQPVCILEAMKLMNEIEMPERGTIREVAAEDGAAVDYGTVLVYYEPAE